MADSGGTDIIITITICIILLSIGLSGCISDDDEEKKKFIPEIDAGKDQTGYANITICFNVSINNEKNFYRYYTWDYDGDGITDENMTNSWSKYLVSSLYESSRFIYKKPGKYTAFVILVDRNGSLAKDSTNVTVLPDPLFFKINTNKSKYNITEPIIVKSILKNNNNVSIINVEGMKILRSSIEFTIKTPENYSLTYLGYLISSAPRLIKLNPNSEYYEENEITNSTYNFGNISEEIFNYDFKTKGEYTIRAKYKAWFNLPGTWQGEMISNTIKIWIE